MFILGWTYNNLKTSGSTTKKYLSFRRFPRNCFSWCDPSCDFHLLIDEIISIGTRGLFAAVHLVPFFTTFCLLSLAVRLQAFYHQWRRRTDRWFYLGWWNPNANHKSTKTNELIIYDQHISSQLLSSNSLDWATQHKDCLSVFGCMGNETYQVARLWRNFRKFKSGDLKSQSVIELLTQWFSSVWILKRQE